MVLNCAGETRKRDVTTMFTYSHANTPQGQSERAYYLSYFKKITLKRPSHGKLKLANSCWQTQVDVCEQHKNSRQTSWQTVGDK